MKIKIKIKASGWQTYDDVVAFNENSQHLLIKTNAENGDMLVTPIPYNQIDSYIIIGWLPNAAHVEPK